MVGLGFQEMIFNYLGSRRDFIDRMNLDDEGFIEISNPMTENYAVVRNSILPCLLASEAVSANAVYPHRIFETGKVARKEPEDNSGTKTTTNLGFLFADREAGFNDVNSHVSALFYYLSRDYSLREEEDPRFIEGRTGAIICSGEKVGVMGEIHPKVLDHWGIQMPCAAAEVDLEGLGRRR
jgi:phenylalanyl-tRNA synthetase beta chain